MDEGRRRKRLVVLDCCWPSSVHPGSMSESKQGEIQTCPNQPKLHVEVTCTLPFRTALQFLTRSLPVQ